MGRGSLSTTTATFLQNLGEADTRNRPCESISTEPPPLPSYEDLLTQVLEAWKIPREEWVELKVEQILEMRQKKWK